MATDEQRSTASVLVVDDERVNREMLRRVVQRGGYLVEMAADGVEALAKLRAREFHLVLLDVHMEGMDGMTCLREIRSFRSAGELPTIMVTAEADNKTIVEAFRGGANDYVTKPIDPEITMARVTTHLAIQRMQSQLRASEERYALAARGANAGLWDWDADHGELYLSPRWKELLGYGDEEFPSEVGAWRDALHPEDRHLLELLFGPVAGANEKSIECEMRMRHRDESYRWMLCSGISRHADDGQTRRAVGSLADVTQGKVRDPLTGLSNRLLFRDQLERAVHRLNGQGAEHLAVLFLDLDNFKLVNDSLGHHVGDQLLVTVAQRLKAGVRATDEISRGGAGEFAIARHGGDEFTLLLERLHSPAEAERVAMRLLAALDEPLSLDGHEIVVGASIGIATCNDERRAPEDLMREADTAMYVAKSAGRGRYRLFDPAMQAAATRRFRLEKDLRAAVKDRSFYLCYQPIVRLSNRRIEGLEALVRWNHPQQDPVGPDVFVQVVEELGLIGELGQWIAEEACRQTVAFNSVVADGVPLTMNINCSVRQLNAEFVDNIERILDTTGVARSWIKIEVTEGTLMANSKSVLPILERLRALGLRIGIDDFGTGYSSLAYLHRLPLDFLKIDRSFITGMTRTSESMEIVRTILTLAATLKLDVVAEGVETEEQRCVLMDLGCTHAQGYLFGRPSSPEIIAPMVARPQPANVFDLQTLATT